MPQLALVAASLCGAAAARAQTVAGGPTISFQTANYVPQRGLPGQDAGSWPVRPQEWTPSAISFADCEADIFLAFQLQLSNFSASQYIRAWASVNGDCTSDSARGVNTTVQSCWPVSDLILAPLSQPGYPMNIYARDILRFQNNQVPYNPQWGVPREEAWCRQQPTDTAIPIVLTFVITDSTDQAISGATPATYGESPSPPFLTDMQAPAAPQGLYAGIEQTAILLSWSGTDNGSGVSYATESTEVMGFAVFMDPPASVAVDASVYEERLYCPPAPDAGIETTATDGSSDGTVDALTADASDAAGGGTVDGAAVTDAEEDGGAAEAGEAGILADATVEDGAAEASVGTDAGVGDATTGADAAPGATSTWPPVVSIWDGGTFPDACEVIGSNSYGAGTETVCTGTSALLGGWGAGTAAADGGVVACTPGAVVCSTTENASALCDDAGTPGSASICATGEVCTATGCATSCTSGAVGCVGGSNTPWWCSDAGTVVVDDAGCGGGYTCSDGVCNVTVTAGDDAGTSSSGDASVGGVGGIINVSSFTNITSSPAPAQYVGDVISPQSTGYQVKGLQDGVAYHFAVAVIDAVGNIGPLSDQQCGIPAPVDDFWADYADAGGLAGGGFCSVRAPGKPHEPDESSGIPLGVPIFGLGLLGALGTLVRRRRDK